MNKQEVKEVVQEFKQQINAALEGENQSEDIKAAVYEMLKALNVQLP
ncbi:hypothetical protein KDJ21_015700 [Metabacillus litoralis]|nr:hypothetical protein [Metabacillus litoralis]MCM3163877.1 hypothetical protein [Metabacillus litoralis]UHA58303.1 hypothetical protein KDJ21_015700 [Metabacillus litoralis]